LIKPLIALIVVTLVTTSIVLATVGNAILGGVGLGWWIIILLMEKNKL
jgi:hypothetical protein